MPPRPGQPCKTPGCRGRTKPGKPTCGECRTRANRDLRQRRGHSTTQGYGHAHRTRFRPGVLARDRQCRICKKAEATEADHYPLDRKTLVVMGLDADNPEYGRGLCGPCHSSYTASVPEQRGGWYRHAPW